MGEICAEGLGDDLVEVWGPGWVGVGLVRYWGNGELHSLFRSGPQPDQQ